MTRALRGCAALSVVLVLAACGTPQAQDYGGRWKPVNRFEETPAEIPLTPAYTFYATPIDATLKTMLERWATDAGLKLAYRLGSDFTLYKPVARIRTTDLQLAASELSAIYAAQGVFVTTDGKQILVQPASDTRVDPAPTHDRGTPCQTGLC